VAGSGLCCAKLALEQKSRRRAREQYGTQSSGSVAGAAALISYLLRMSRATSGTVSPLWLIKKSSILTGAPRRSLSNFDHVSSLFAFHCQRTINLIMIARIVVFWSHLIFLVCNTEVIYIISFISVTFCQLLLYSPHVW
jgi:hypothetical protein